MLELSPYSSLVYMLKSSVHPSKRALLNTPPRTVHMSPEGCLALSEAGPQVPLYRAQDFLTSFVASVDKVFYMH